MPKASLTGLRVLVVEDEMMVAMLLEDMLSNIGCTTIGPANRLEPALTLAVEAAVDVAILDVNLNGKETFAVADLLAAHAIPFVFATGYGTDKMCERYRNAPALRKPFQQQDLKRALTEALEREHPHPKRTGT